MRSAIAELVEQLGIQSMNPSAENLGAMQFGSLGEIDLPQDLIDVYEIGDAIKFATFPGQMLPFLQSKTIKRAAFEPSVYDSWPFFVANEYQSDEIAVIIHGPAKGYVMQRAHDGFDRIIAPDVRTFFGMLAQNPPTDDYFGDEEEVWIYPHEMTPQDRVTTEELLAGVAKVSDPYEGESLAALAMSMMLDEDFVATFSQTLFPIPNFRSIIWGRLAKIDSDEARAGAKMYEADFNEQSQPKGKTGILGKLFGR